MPVVTFSIPTTRGNLYERLRTRTKRYNLPLSCVICEALESFLSEDHPEIPTRPLTTKEKILDAIVRLGGATAPDIALELGKDPVIIRTELARMNKQGIVGKTGKKRLGKWCLLDTARRTNEQHN